MIMKKNLVNNNTSNFTNRHAINFVANHINSIENNKSKIKIKIKIKGIVIKYAWFVQFIEINFLSESNYNNDIIISNMLSLLIPLNSFIKLILIISHKHNCNSHKNSKHYPFSLQTFHIMNKDKVQIDGCNKF